MFVALFAGASAEAALYKCKMPDGSTRFSDAPCPATGERRDPRVSDPVAPEPAAPAQADVIPQADVTAPDAAASSPPAPAPASDGPAPATAATQAAPAAPEPAAASPAAVGRELKNEPTSRRSFDFVIFLAAIVTLAANIFLLVHAWKHVNGWLALAMLLIGPICLVYPLFKRSKATLIALALYVGGPAAAWASFTPGVDLMWAEDGAVTRYETAWPANSRARFGLGDDVKVVTQVRWKERSWERHYLVQWVWYTDDEPVGSFQNLLQFEGQPYVFHGHVPAAQLGPGSHHVEVYIDGELFQVESFEVDEY